MVAPFWTRRSTWYMITAVILWILAIVLLGVGGSQYAAGNGYYTYCDGEDFCYQDGSGPTGVLVGGGVITFFAIIWTIATIILSRYESRQPAYAYAPGAYGQPAAGINMANAQPRADVPYQYSNAGSVYHTAPQVQGYPLRV
jgi:hypothetical protein